MSEERYILFINACARKDSRTLRLAKHLLSKLEKEEKNLCIREVPLFETELPRLSETQLSVREEAARGGDLSNSFVRLASEFRDAEKIVIAAPYWDLSFPAVLKEYLEAVMTQKITFDYSEMGIPVGLCHAEKLYYVMTAGGPIIRPEHAYSYVKTLSEVMFGIKDTCLYAAEGLDIWDTDVEAVLKKTEAEIDKG